MEFSTAFLILLAIFCVWVVIKVAASRIKPKQNEPMISGDGSRPVDVRMSSLTPEQRSRFRRDSVLAGARPHPGVQEDHWKSPPSAQSRPIHLTRRQLEHVNIQRKMAGRPALNSQGVRAAVAIAGGPNDPRVQPDTASDWLTYLIVYQCLFADHHSSRVSVDSGVTVFPCEPHNGQGSDCSGAGASGNWGSPSSLALGAAALAASTAPTITDLSVNGGAGYTDAPAGSVAGDVVSDRSDAQSYSAPAPEYTAPSPSPSYDSGSSFDSGSSSGGGDSGGGGGGSGD